MLLVGRDVVLCLFLSLHHRICIIYAKSVKSVHQPKTHLDLDHLDRKFVCVVCVVRVVHSSSLQTPRQVDRQADRFKGVELPFSCVDVNHYKNILDYLLGVPSIAQINPIFFCNN